MARIYSHKKGRSGSKKPPIKVKQRWIKYKKDDVEKLIVKLAKDQKSSATIGTILRDSYGIPDSKLIIGKSVSEIMKENKLGQKLPEDLMNLLKRAVLLNEHLMNNKADQHGKKGLQTVESKIRRLAKYYIRAGAIPKNWRYDITEAKLIIQK